MTYRLENATLRAALRRAAQELNTDLNGLDRELGLIGGTLNFITEYGIVPEGELMARLERLLGMTSDEINGRSGELMLEAPRTIAVYKKVTFEKGDKAIENMVGTMMVDRMERDDREYVGLIVNDSSMRRAGILQGDVVVLRRQAVARDGDIVAAETDGVTVVRRYRRKGSIAWLDAEGYVGDGPDVIPIDGETRTARVRIWGKVVSSTRLYEKDGIAPDGD